MLLVVGVISHLWCAAHLVGIAHHSLYSVDWLCKMDFVLSEHIWMSSFRSNVPTLFSAYTVVTGSLKQLATTAVLLLLAIDFPTCFLLGVNT